MESVTIALGAAIICMVGLALYIIVHTLNRVLNSHGKDKKPYKLPRCMRYTKKLNDSIYGEVSKEPLEIKWYLSNGGAVVGNGKFFFMNIEYMANTDIELYEVLRTYATEAIEPVTLFFITENPEHTPTRQYTYAGRGEFQVSNIDAYKGNIVDVLAHLHIPYFCAVALKLEGKGI